MVPLWEGIKGHMQMAYNEMNAEISPKGRNIPLDRIFETIQCQTLQNPKDERQGHGGQLPYRCDSCPRLLRIQHRPLQSKCRTFWSKDSLLPYPHTLR